MEPEWNKALKKFNVLLIKYWGIGAEKKISKTEILFFFQNFSQVFKFFMYFFFVGEYEF